MDLLLCAPFLPVILLLAGVCSRHAAAEVVIETRAQSLCTYQVASLSERLTTPSCFLNDQDFVVAVATDADDDLVFFSDILTRKLFRVEIGQTPQELLYGLGSVEGIAVDWLAKNIFWTDFDLNHVCVSRYDGTNRAILVDDDVVNPRGIVTDPFNGFLFWSDLRDSTGQGRLERSSMDGTDRVAIVDDDLVSPSGLVIDFAENRLYFADRGTDRIESVTYDGQDRQVLYEQKNADFFDITIFGDHLYATKWRASEPDGEIIAVRYKDPNAGNVLPALNHDNLSLGITIMDEEYQPEELNGARGACRINNGYCQQICLPTGTRRKTCACSTGYRLADNGLSCETDYISEHFLLVADSALNGIFQVDPHSEDDHEISALPLPDLQFPVALAYDHVDGMVYWTDRARSAVGRATLNGTVLDYELFGDIADPGGIALDTRQRVIYWTDEGRNKISVAGMDGNPEVFIGEDLDQPRAIAVNWLNGDVYWTDWGTNAKIERVSRDGSNRQVLVEDDIVWPNCLAIDPYSDIMYWCDASLDRIETADLDGGSRTILVSFDYEVHLFSLAIYGDFIYWTDWREHRLTRADRWTGEEVEEVGQGAYLRMQGLTAFEFPDIYYETTSSAELSTTVSLEPSPPMNSAINVVLIAAAAGGGLVLILIVTLVVCCVVRCARSKGGRGPDDHNPMSVRSTSFVGAYDPKGLPQPGQIPNNNQPPPLPPDRPKDTEPIYQDIEDYQASKGGGAAYQAYLNPIFKGEGSDDAPSASAPKNSPRYTTRTESPPKTAASPQPKKTAPPTAAKPPKFVKKAKAPPRPDDTYLTPDVPPEQEYTALKLPSP